jgi:K+-sensing histidine kinase KdpD
MMNKTRFPLFARLLTNSLKAVVTVAAITVPLVLIGRATLGEGVIALLYLVPVTWSASRWGLVPGMGAALTAGLCFDFLFIPPFYTFAIGSLEGWMILIIFLAVAFVVVERIQASLSKAREAVFMYELSSALASQRTPEAVAHTVAGQIRQLFQATLVNVVFHTEKQSPSIVVSEPSRVTAPGRPDRILPILNALGLVGEIQIWRGAYMELPAEDSRLLQNFASQTARALERTQQIEKEEQLKGLMPKASTSRR